MSQLSVGMPGTVHVQCKKLGIEATCLRVVFVLDF